MTSAPSISARTAAVVPDPQPQGQALRVVPIRGPSLAEPAYRLLDADTLGAVKVSEVSDAGSVPELLVVNDLDAVVFLMDGQELVGAKQNRILNTDVLVAGRSTTKIPVSCVERGRWSMRSRHFVPGRSASHLTRSSKSARVHHSLKSSGSHDANQGAVWREVETCLYACAASESSHTRALSDAYAKRQSELAEFRAGLRLPDDAVGLAVFHGPRLRGVDLFDRHATLRHYWPTLVDSYALDYLGVEPDVTPAEPTPPEAEVVRNALAAAAEGAWETFASPGLGVDYRLASKDWNGSALVWEDRAVVHLQLFPAGQTA